MNGVIPLSIETVTETETKIDLDYPSQWGVKFFNDDRTPMDFVSLALMHHFNLSPEDAEIVMWKVHEEGEAVVGSYTKDIAETKATTVESIAREAGFPLRLQPVAI